MRTILYHVLGRVCAASASWLVPAAILGVWSAGSASGLIPAGVLASPWQTAETAWTLSVDGTLPWTIADSLRRATLGFLIGGGLGVAAGVVSGTWRVGEDILDGTLQMLRTIPFVALAPLFIVWFGITEVSKVALVAFASFFPLYLNTHSGIRDVDGRLIEVGRVTGLQQWGLVREVLVLGALPSILVGLRYSLVMSIIALVVAEQINLTTGIGALLGDARRFVQTDVMALCIAIYAILGWTVNRLAEQLARWQLAWLNGVRAS
ncbi:ABC transporter permease [Bradyrhizobium sp.]|uniref:ABC transporter permease n=1 Tax=Bradyrhizobium sp. TaxID=376 RepID=UPI0039E32BC2